MGLGGFFRKMTGRSRQDFLEAKPYFDQSNIPVNTFKAKVNEIPHHHNAS